VCDVLPGGAGEEAGLQIGDVLIEADGRAISTPSQLDGSMYVHDIKEPMPVVVLRDGQRVALRMQVREESHQADSIIDPTNPQRNLVPPLGAMAATVTPDMQASLGPMPLS
jgi:predicted metalloprotease with PDZ domain